MGICGSTDGSSSSSSSSGNGGNGQSASADQAAAQARTQAIDKDARDSENAEMRVNKLLLLGAGSSGKSTLFKQMISIYGRGFSDSERRTYTPIIHNNVLTAMRTLIIQAPRYGTLSSGAQVSVDALTAPETMREDQPLTPELAEAVSKLWRTEDAIATAHVHQAEFQLTESAKYFFDKIDEVSAHGYLPSEQDVLRCRAPTTGIVENTFEIDGNTFKMFDVGGQRNERKKWIHCFENVTAVLFVAAISEYNQVLYEDATANRLVESLTLFDEIVNSKWFKRTSMILMLNKRDLLAEKLEKWPLRGFFADYDGEDDKDEVQVTNWIRARFLEKNADPEKQIYTHVTCATDTNNIRVVFAAVKDTIIRKNLSKIGLL